jgi:hypothetical protein
VYALFLVSVPTETGLGFALHQSHSAQLVSLAQRVVHSAPYGMVKLWHKRDKFRFVPAHAATPELAIRIKSIIAPAVDQAAGGIMPSTNCTCTQRMRESYLVVIWVPCTDPENLRQSLPQQINIKFNVQLGYVTHGFLLMGSLPEHKQYRIKQNWV